jgi:hypothetical protein
LNGLNVWNYWNDWNRSLFKFDLGCQKLFLGRDLICQTEMLWWQPERGDECTMPSFDEWFQRATGSDPFPLINGASPRQKRSRGWSMCLGKDGDGGAGLAKIEKVIPNPFRQTSVVYNGVA